MSETRTCQKNPTKDAFGPGNELAHQFGVALGKEGITPPMLKAVVDNPVSRRKVGQLLRGEVVGSTITLNQLVEREIVLTKQVCGKSGIVYPGNSVIEQALKKAEKAWGNVTEHDRFIPKGLNRRSLLGACYDAGLKLDGDSDAADCDGEQLSTEIGVIRQDLITMMTPTDLADRPFYLPMADQEIWAKEQGGDGITTVEETLFMIIRKILESQLSPWACGWCRCRNSFGSGFSLVVCWGTDDGLEVDYGIHDDYDWIEGALVRKFLKIGN